jgi:predicted  nucleic acid-binding Zn-ribbon protein
VTWDDDEPTPVLVPRTRSELELRFEANLTLANAELAKWRELAESRKRDLAELREAKEKSDRDRRKLLVHVDALKARLQDANDEIARLRRRGKE